MNINNLSAKVQARYLVNALAAKIAPAAFAMFAEFNGKQIQLAKGTTHTAKFRKAVEALNLPSTRGVISEAAWITSSLYTVTLRVQVDVCVPTGDGYSRSFRGETTVYLGDLKDGIVSRLYTAHEPGCTDFTVDSILEARAAVRAAREALSAAESKLFGFGEHDNG